MSSYVYVNVSFPCNKPEEVSEIAKQHHEILKTKEKFGEDMILRDACHFLKDICENKFATYSGNGSMISWQ